ncbi:MAG: hypothetical protein LWX83_06530 [Anaerolineae bacterium]|nr:hypothetical protein [Anaerolineae bacterium]
MSDAISSISAYASGSSYANAVKPQNKTSAGETNAGAPENQNKTGSVDNAQNTKSQAISGSELTDKQESEVRQLQQIDREVRAHEQAHLAAGGNLVRGGATYEYQTGPDGKRYAVGGEVQIDISAVNGDPEATIEKARQIRQAALAPADPSSQDRAVAAQATRMEITARQELTQESGKVPSDQGSSRDDSENASNETSTQQAQRAYQSSSSPHNNLSPVLNAVSA